MDAENNTALLMTLHCLPATAWVKKYLEADKVLIEQHENYQKQSYRNRFQLSGPDDVLMLTVPVVAGRSSTKVAYKEILIDYKTQWQRTHLRTIHNCYANSPFYEHYMPFFEAIYLSGEVRLWDFNISLLSLMLNLAGIKSKHEFTGNFIPYGAQNDVRGLAGRNALPDENFKKYNHLFDVPFRSNLSFIDALFLFGPDATQMI